MRRGLAGVLALCLLVPGGAISVAQDVEGALSTAEALPDDFTPDALSCHEGVRSLVAGHRKNMPGLLLALKGADSWKVRMAAGYALKEMGFQSLLVAAVDDSNPLVRTFARVVLGRPPVSPSAATPENTKSYAVDDAYRDRAAQLARAPVALDPRQIEQRRQAVVADLLVPVPLDPTLPYGSDARYVATMIALQDPAGTCAAVLKVVAGRDDVPLKLEALEVLQTLATRSSRDAIYDLSKDFRAAALADRDGRVRHFGLCSLADIGPLEVRFDAVLRLTKDPDESVRATAAFKALELSGDFEAAGNPKRADELLDLMARFSASKGAPPNFDKELADTKTALDRERELLYKGETVQKSKGVRIDRYLRVDRHLEHVDQEEYDAAVARYGKPYVSEKQFREVRAENNERLQKIEDERARRLGEVRLVGPTPDSSGRRPANQALPAGGTQEGEPAKSPLSYRSAGFVFIFAVLGWLIFRMCRRKP